jgi:hypothetical protein
VTWLECRFKGHLAAKLPELYSRIRSFAVGWVHSNAGHNLACQLANSALYKDATGRCNGEYSELAWVSVTDAIIPTQIFSIQTVHSLQAAMKVLAQLTRYESRVRHKESLDAGLSHWSIEKRLKQPELLAEVRN